MTQPSNTFELGTVNDYNNAFLNNLGLLYMRNSNKFVNSGVSDYYVDSSQANVGKRPIYTMRNKECQIPSIFSTNNINLQGKIFSCTKPDWKPECM